MANLLRQALYFGPLLLGSAGSLLLPSRTATPGVVFVVLAVYAHAAARLMGEAGPGKAMLFLQALPFFGLAVAGLGKLEALPALLVVGSGTAAGAAILGGEWLLLKGSGTFTGSLGFLGACCTIGVGLSLLPPMLFSGLALLALTLVGYGVARRVRG
jgi:hypothetical protein